QRNAMLKLHIENIHLVTESEGVFSLDVIEIALQLNSRAPGEFAVPAREQVHARYLDALRRVDIDVRAEQTELPLAPLGLARVEIALQVDSLARAMRVRAEACLAVLPIIGFGIERTARGAIEIPALAVNAKVAALAQLAAVTYRGAQLLVAAPGGEQPALGIP